jgi:AAA+ ATPase superfamily predicted ATPase
MGEYTLTPQEEKEFTQKRSAEIKNIEQEALENRRKGFDDRANPELAKYNKLTRDGVSPRRLYEKDVQAVVEVRSWQL